MNLHTLKPRPGAKHRVKRLGCGESSGHGKTSGKGHKGQKARSGGSIRLGFEGGQMPLIRRLPKRGFNNAAFKTRYALVNLRDLNQFESGTSIDEKFLREKNIIRGSFDGIKILGDGELSKNLTVTAHKVSASAAEKIQKAGGSFQIATVEKAAETAKPAKTAKAAAAPKARKPKAAAARKTRKKA